ncbi:MAG: 4'-phosphopantetheinyl transferase superfamily protein [Butyricicoccus pullicaecorum]|nr:4'-phosphopantetheinyl transferase superfamily protein [Butyricicoccus pullicaecorum]MDO4668549.1 4'-phosphopantetheinyl transferase superfamily protein [Butyricicoccus pullicaecorum]
MTILSVSLYYAQVCPDHSLSQFDGQISPDRLAYLSSISHPHARACSLTGDLLLNAIVRHLIPNASFPLIRKNAAGGKPYLPAYPNFHFSISHSADLVVCAVAPVPVGVDIELPRKVRSGIAARWFSQAEQELLAQDPSVFFDLWTAKEAVLKEIGCGLCGGLQTVSVGLSPAPHLTAPVHGQWHALTRAKLPCELSVMVAVSGTQPAHVTVHPKVPL